ncbi:MAG: sulfatase-like hydrolase/transferase [Caldilineaceae bacterium]|nr:sulfatase-like hydrolase/transferase [Caldilineaceae bacterium]MDE0339602.1 sulfatase-like hydrolase/transferase [Caldilineaceae bacterium]
MRNNPNVIICICDQLRAFEVGCYGNSVIRTPNIDSLARDGVRFEHAVSTDPVCMPARSSLISGQYARTCMGALGNASVPDEQGRPIVASWPVQDRVHLPDATIAEQFKAAAYDTALIGKWHIHPAPETVGFDYTLHPRVNHRHTGQDFVENGGPPQLVDGFSVDYEIENVLSYLADDRNNPFFLYYSISPPHMPLADAPEEYLTMYDPDDMPLRPNVFVDGELAHDEHWFKVYLWDFLYYSQKLPHTLDLPKGFDLRTLTALYYGLTTWVDDMVGKLMKGLRTNGLLDNTIVVFTSDHGDNLGSHHRFNKGLLIEESIRIPMIFHAPGLWEPGVNSSQVAQLIDIMPTVLDASGCPVPEHVQGRNLSPVLTGERNHLDENWGFIETSGGEIGVRTPTHLLGRSVLGGNGSAEQETTSFFDLRTDPYETCNLVGTGQQVRTESELENLLKAWDRNTPWMSTPETKSAG